MNSTSPKKEWVAEPGYCNCLLVTMARVGILSIELNSQMQVPNLEKLSKNKPDTLKWLKAQEFNYEKLSSIEIIKILSDSAGISNGFFGKKTAQINIHDAQKDNDPIVQRIYYLTLSKINNSIILKIELLK